MRKRQVWQVADQGDQRAPMIDEFCLHFSGDLSEDYNPPILIYKGTINSYILAAIVPKNDMEIAQVMCDALNAEEKPPTVKRMTKADYSRLAKRQAKK